jgi:glutamyl-tRNA synthetase
MPLWAHLPLILKPDGHGKLSKRDGERLGFPVFAMDWTDPNTNEKTIGFKERGFVPEAFINLLALLGWNNGTDQEIFTKEELIAQFSLERVHKGGAKFDYEKAKWFNQEWIKKLSNDSLLPRVIPYFEKANIQISDDAYLLKIIGMVKERCHFLTDFVDQSTFFFEAPLNFDLQPIQAKWDDNKKTFFNEFIKTLEAKKELVAAELETEFKELASSLQIKPGDLMLPFRIMLVGGKFGPGVFDIVETIGTEASIKRIQYCLGQL